VAGFFSKLLGGSKAKSTDSTVNHDAVIASDGPYDPQSWGGLASMPMESLPQGILAVIRNMAGGEEARLSNPWQISIARADGAEAHIVLDNLIAAIAGQDFTQRAKVISEYVTSYKGIVFDFTGKSPDYVQSDIFPVVRRKGYGDNAIPPLLERSLSIDASTYLVLARDNFLLGLHEQNIIRFKLEGIDHFSVAFRNLNETSKLMKITELETEVYMCAGSHAGDSNMILSKDFLNSIFEKFQIFSISIPVIDVFIFAPSDNESAVGRMKRLSSSLYQRAEQKRKLSCCLFEFDGQEIRVCGHVDT
jgi:uncharacterized protein YtpQ (UPF0354 family)